MIKNLSKNTIVSYKHQVADSILKKTKGMIGGGIESLIIKTRFGVHTFFMRSEIGVIVVNDKKVVVAIKKLEPNNVYFWNPRYDTIIEMSPLLIKTSKTEIGDKLDF